VESSVELGDVKAGGADRGERVTGRLATAKCACPEERVAGTLKRAEGHMFGADVLVEAELAIRGEHAAQLLERRRGIGHAAEDPDDDSGIEGPILRRQGVGDAVDDLDRHGSVASALRSRRARRRVRLDRENVLDRRRVELEGAAVAAAELEHATP
jgi:hypothetical protein